MKTFFKTNKVPFIIVAATLLVFAGLLPFLPAEMPSHMLLSGQANQFSSKYLVFLLLAVADIGGTLALSIWINQAITPFLSFSRLKFTLTLYFPLLVICLAAMLIVAAYGQLGWPILLGFHILYLAALAAIALKK